MDGSAGPPANMKPVLKSCPAPTGVFTGRQDVLSQMHAYFSSNIGMRHVFVLYGLGGAGKSQIAYKFVDMCTRDTETKQCVMSFHSIGAFNSYVFHLQRFSDIFFVDASTAETITVDLRNIALAKEVGNSDQDALGWLCKQHDEWLLLFNNADDTTLNLQEYFPSGSYGNILITTRNRAIHIHSQGTGSHCEISGMTPNDAKELLLKVAKVKEESRSDNGRLAMTIVKVIYIFDRIIRMLTVFIQDLGFLALAIIQAGAYILESQCGLERYLNMYQNCLGELLEQYKDQVQKIDGYKWTVYTTWNISFEQLSPHASTFLKICAFLHNDYITEEIFQNAAVNIATITSDLPIIIQELDSFNMAKRFLESFQIAQDQWDIKFLAVIKEICSYSLINFDSVNNVYSIHPLVHAWTLTKVSDIAMTQTCTQFILGISINWRFNDVEDYIFRQKFLPHLDTALANMRDAVSDAVRILGMSFFLVYFENGQWTKAEKLCMQVMEIRKKLLGEKHPATLTGMANLASTYRNQGRWKEAEELEVQVMDITKRVLGAEHPDTLKSMANFALTFWNQGRWKEAEELF
ncbi:MAG TPA: tetratricopeptide repeat protein, partial [Bacteroidia bacterium]|nr:tetratricopeptide repeat protein [Bacteroidia bacterium]